MTTADAIAAVGETIVDLLGEEMTIIDASDISLASPAARGQGNNAARLTWFLYGITPNEHLRNTDHRPQPYQAPSQNPNGDDSGGTKTGPFSVAGQPLIVDLQYLLTAHPATTGEGQSPNIAQQQRVLGEAMRVLNDHGRLPASRLTDELAGEHITIVLDDTSIDTVMNMWGTFDEPSYRPSVSYLVTPLRIASEREADVGRVMDRTVEEYSTTAGGNTDG